jgi:hypothetical protein
MPSDFATARHHLEHAHNCLSGGGDDDLTQKCSWPLSLLIDAALTAEHTANETRKVVEFPPIGREPPPSILETVWKSRRKPARRPTTRADAEGLYRSPPLRLLAGLEDGKDATKREGGVGARMWWRLDFFDVARASRATGQLLSAEERRGFPFTFLVASRRCCWLAPGGTPVHSTVRSPDPA